MSMRSSLQRCNNTRFYLKGWARFRSKFGVTYSWVAKVTWYVQCMFARYWMFARHSFMGRHYNRSTLWQQSRRHKHRINYDRLYNLRIQEVILFLIFMDTSLYYNNDPPPNKSSTLHNTTLTNGLLPTPQYQCTDKGCTPCPPQITVN